MINAYESGSNSPGAGTFSRDLPKTKTLQCRDFTWALHMEKSISLLFPSPLGTWLQMTGALFLITVSSSELPAFEHRKFWCLETLCWLPGERSVPIGLLVF